MKTFARGEYEALRTVTRGLLDSLPDGKGLGSKSSRGLSATISLPDLDFAILQQAADNLGAPIEDFLLTGFAVLLCRLSGQESVQIGQTGSGVRSFSLEGGGSFETMIRSAECSSGCEEASCWPISFCYEHAKSTPASTACELELRVRRISVGGCPAGAECELTAGAETWKVDLLGRWLRYLKFFWAAAGKNPAQPANKIPFLDPPSILDFYAKYNQTFTAFPEDRIDQLFSRQAALSPDATAVVFHEVRYSYRELDVESTRLASVLRRMGAGPGLPVAICMERSAWMPMALLAVMKSGSCYVPLDPRNPPARLKGIFEECHPVMAISDSSRAHLVESLASSIPVLRIDEAWPEASRVAPRRSAELPGDLAYIIYTSGSTGRPKGVMVRHRSLTNVLWAMREAPGISRSDRMLALATISFDIATLDMLLPLIAGASVAIASTDSSLEPHQLRQLVEGSRITVLQTTPVAWRMLAEAGWKANPGFKMLCGGEALPRALANKLLESGGELWNCYGPTEITIWSGNLRIRAGSGIVPIGPPIANTSYYIMDEAGCPQPPGIPGELYIGGAGVSYGYVARPELNQERFLNDPFHPGERIFRTGDIARILDDGNLEIFGRLDHQVKVRGFRIELGAIESVLRTNPAVEDAVAILWKDGTGESQLVAYVVRRDHASPFAPGEIRAFAAKVLPDYMLPQRIVELQKLPLTISGKVDRLKLPDPVAAAASVKPASALEEKLVRIFRDVLAQPSLGVTDDFFDFGGYSLVVARLFTRINRVLGTELPLSIIYDAPTVRQLALVVGGGQKPQRVVPIRPAGHRAPLFVIHSYLIYDAMLHAVDSARPVFGLRADYKDRWPHEPKKIIDCAIAIDKAAPQGPIYLAGWCAAASLTLEVARELGKMGRRVPLTILIDAERPGFWREIARQIPWNVRFRASLRFHKQIMRRQKTLDNLLHVCSMIGGLLCRIPAKALRSFDADLARDNLMFPENYAWEPFSGKVALFRATEAPRLPGADETSGWGSVVVGGPRVIFVPGSHVSMFREPQLAGFGQKLREVLAESELLEGATRTADAVAVAFSH